MLGDRQGEGQQAAAADVQRHAVAESLAGLAVYVEGDLELETAGQLRVVVGHILVGIHNLLLAVVLIDARAGFVYYYVGYYSSYCLKQVDMEDYLTQYYFD